MFFDCGMWYRFFTTLKLQKNVSAGVMQVNVHALKLLKWVQPRSTNKTKLDVIYVNNI